MTTTLTQTGGIISKDPNNLDFTNIPTLGNTLINKVITMLINMEYIYLNSDYYEAMDKLHLAKEKFLEEFGDNPGDIKAAWFQYKLLHMNDHELSLIDSLKNNENRIVKIMEAIPENEPYNFKEIAEFSLINGFTFID